ncbi:MAG TPA: ABC transporter substrate-binding protein [Clostridiaceae bacterium]
MNKLNKKLAIIVAAVMTTTTILSGCAAKKVAPTTTTKTPYALDWYYVGNGPQADSAMVDAAATAMLKDINVTLVTHCIDWGTYQAKMTTNLATGEKIDLFMTALGWGSLIVDDVRKAAVVDITTLAPKYAPNAVATLKGGFWEYSKIDGKNYSLPVNKEKANSIGFIFNQAYVTKYSLQDATAAAKTMEAITPMAKLVKAAEPTIFPIEPNGGMTSFWLSNDNPVASNLVVLPHNSTDDKFIAAAANPNFAAVADVTRGWYNAGYIQKDAPTILDVTPFRKAGKNFIGFDPLKPGKDVEDTVSSGTTWKQTVASEPYTSTAETMGCMMSIAKSAKDPARVLEFADKLYSDVKLLNLIDYGIEGTHYVVKSPGVIDFAPATDGGKKSGYNLGTPWMFGDQFKSYLFSNEDPNKWAAFKNFNAAAKPVAAAGFIYNDDNTKNEEAACVNVQKEFDPSLNVGAIDPKVNIPKYIAKLDAAGMQKILTDVNSQYDAWKIIAKK